MLTAGYMLWMIRRMYLGPTNERYTGVVEINKRELFTLVPQGIIVIAIGVYPQPLLELLGRTLDQINGIVPSKKPENGSCDVRTRQRGENERQGGLKWTREQTLVFGSFR